MMDEDLIFIIGFVALIIFTFVLVGIVKLHNSYKSRKANKI